MQSYSFFCYITRHICVMICNLFSNFSSKEQAFWFPFKKMLFAKNWTKKQISISSTQQLQLIDCIFVFNFAQYIFNKISPPRILYFIASFLLLLLLTILNIECKYNRKRLAKATKYTLFIL